MRCKEAKAKIKKLERENFNLRHQKIRSMPEDRTYDFNLLEIVVRPRREPLFQDILRVDLRVLGSPEMAIPDICKARAISLAAIHLVKMDRHNFIKHIGEIMARELVDFADKELA